VQDRFKIAVGGGVAALLAIIAHGPLGMGAHFVAGLQHNADAALAEAGLSGVKVRFPSSPLSRTAIISGSAPGAEIRLAVAAVSGIKGVGAVLTEAPPGVAEPQRASADACQSSLNKAVAGRALSFRSGSAYLSPRSNRIIHDVATVLKACPTLHVEVAGHGNASGSAAINKAMSEERAKRVRDALIASGVPADALSAKGYGSSDPIKASDALSPANRRVVFTVSKKGA